MASGTLDVPVTTQEAFDAFSNDYSQFALPLEIVAGKLKALPAIAFPTDPGSRFRNALSGLEQTINVKVPLYLILRHNKSPTFITYIPYLGNSQLNELYIAHRESITRAFGETHFSVSLICKEPGAVLDERSWEEINVHLSEGHAHEDERETCESNGTVIDLGLTKTQCRLCDRRMKNQIDSEAFEALKKLDEGGNCVQLTVDPNDETLKLHFQESCISPIDVAPRIPKAYPSFTFYRHSASQLLYFIFFSPDSAPVKIRMVHTMAVPGLLNVTAKEQGVQVSQKIEIHDVDDLVFEEGDGRIGKFRSVYLLNEQKGTESVWEGMPIS